MLKTLRNLLLLEILAATFFVGIVATILLDRLAYYQEAAEKANMELMISSIRSALRIRMATMMTAGKSAQYRSLLQDNPMDWLEQKPANYAGVASPQVNPSTLPGHWMFDPTSRTLVYWVKHSEHFHPDSDGERKVRLRIIPLTEAAVSENVNEPLVTGARIVLVEPYKWF